MNKIEYKILKEGKIGDILVPITLVLVDYKEVTAAGSTMRVVCEKIAATIPGPAAINIFDMEAVTTTSDGIMIDGSMTCMAASDYGKIDKEFGFVEMYEIPYSEQLIKEEPHLKQWDLNYPGCRLLMGPHPDKRPLPVHNAVVSGRATCNNSATEVMNVVSMEEMLLPLIGQMEMMKDGNLEIGMTGEITSVGIGMLVPELYGRIVPNRQYQCGDTSHECGVYSKTLKRDIPCIVADKKVLGKYILKALSAGLVPARDISPSPAILSVAKHLGVDVDYDNITERAYIELADIGCTKEWMREKVDTLTPEKIIEKARTIIPGIDDSHFCKAQDILETKQIEL